MKKILERHVPYYEDKIEYCCTTLEDIRTRTHKARADKDMDELEDLCTRRAVTDAQLMAYHQAKSEFVFLIEE